MLYDRDCGFCRWSLAYLLGWDRARRLRPVALQEAEAERLLVGMEEDERLASAHLVMPDGRVHSGGPAVPPLLRLLPGGAPLAAVAALVPGLSTRGYDWVARHRGLLGKRLSAPRVRRATQRIAERS